MNIQPLGCYQSRRAERRERRRIGTFWFVVCGVIFMAWLTAVVT